MEISEEDISFSLNNFWIISFIKLIKTGSSDEIGSVLISKSNPSIILLGLTFIFSLFIVFSLLLSLFGFSSWVFILLSLLTFSLLIKLIDSGVINCSFLNLSFLFISPFSFSFKQYLFDDDFSFNGFKNFSSKASLKFKNNFPIFPTIFANFYIIIF